MLRQEDEVLECGMDIGCGWDNCKLWRRMKFVDKVRGCGKYERSLECCEEVKVIKKWEKMGFCRQVVGRVENLCYSV